MLVYIYGNSRSLSREAASRADASLTEEQLVAWHASAAAHSSFEWPGFADGLARTRIDLQIIDQRPSQIETPAAPMTPRACMAPANDTTLVEL